MSNNLARGLAAFLAPVAPVYPVFVPEGKPLPAITYRLISEVREQSHDGPAGLAASRYQVTAHARTHNAVLGLVDEITARLAGFVGELGAGVSVVGVEIANVFELGYSPDTESWQVAVDAICHRPEV